MHLLGVEKRLTVVGEPFLGQVRWTPQDDRWRVCKCVADHHAVPCSLVGGVSGFLSIKVLVYSQEVDHDGYHNLPERYRCHKDIRQNDLSLVDVSQLSEGVFHIGQTLDCLNDLCQVACLVNSGVACILLQFGQSL